MNPILRTSLSDLISSQESISSVSSLESSSLGSDGHGHPSIKTQRPPIIVAHLPHQEASPLNNSWSFKEEPREYYSQPAKLPSQVHSYYSQSPNKPSENSCSICPYTTNRKSNLTRHLETMHKKHGSLECCEMTFPSKAELREHKRVSHLDGYDCKICSRSFCRRALLKRHMNVHSGKKDHICRICGYATSHKSNLERHIYRLHGEEAGDSYKTMHAKRGYSQFTESGTLDLSLKRSQSLSGLDKLTDGRSQNQGFQNSLDSLASTTISKLRLCSTSYECESCNNIFESQIELSFHSTSCTATFKNHEEEIINAACILMQLKYSSIV